MLRSLVSRFALLSAGYLVLVSLVGLLTLQLTEAQRHDALTINLAGRQRMLVQTIAREALNLTQRSTASTRQALADAITTFDATLSAMRWGGPAPYLPGSSATLLPASDWEAIARLSEVDRLWVDFSRQAEILLSAEPAAPDFASALVAVDDRADQLVAASDAVVRAFERVAGEHVEQLRWLYGMFILIALALLIGGALVIQRSAIKPLRRLGTAAERIGQGDLSTPVEVNDPLEIERLAGSFDGMRAQLKSSQEMLMAWAAKLEARVDQRTRELAALYEVSREISSQLDLDHVLRSVTDKARELLDGEVAFLCLLDQQGQTLSLRAVSGSRKAVAGTQEPIQHSPATHVLGGDRALLCGIDNCIGWCSIMAEPFRVSHLAAPLRAGERVLGALCIGSRKAGHFSDEAVDLLTKLAGSAAIALQNAYLYKQAERVAMLEERQRIAAEMHDGLAQTLSYLSLKTGRVAELVETGLQPAALKELQNMHATLDQASQEVRRAIASLQEEPRPRQSLQAQLAELIGKVNADGEPPLVEPAIELQAPVFLSSLETDQVMRVVREALLNAQHHARAEHITLRLKQQGTEVAVSVEDDGHGFDPHVLPADGRDHFGISIMRARAARFGGQLSICSTPGQGTQVILKWPVSQGQNDSKHPATGR